MIVSHPGLVGIRGIVGAGGHVEECRRRRAAIVDAMNHVRRDGGDGQLVCAADIQDIGLAIGLSLIHI